MLFLLSTAYYLVSRSLYEMVLDLRNYVSVSVPQRLRVTDRIFRGANSLEIFVLGTLVL